MLGTRATPEPSGRRPVSARTPLPAASMMRGGDARPSRATARRKELVNEADDAPRLLEKSPPPSMTNRRGWSFQRLSIAASIAAASRVSARCAASVGSYPVRAGGIRSSITAPYRASSASRARLVLREERIRRRRPVRRAIDGPAVADDQRRVVLLDRHAFELALHAEDGAGERTSPGGRRPLRELAPAHDMCGVGEHDDVLAEVVTDQLQHRRLPGARGARDDDEPCVAVILQAPASPAGHARENAMPVPRSADVRAARRQCAARTGCSARQVRVNARVISFRTHCRDSRGWHAAAGLRTLAWMEEMAQRPRNREARNSWEGAWTHQWLTRGGG